MKKTLGKQYRTVEGVKSSIEDIFNYEDENFYTTEV